MPRILTTCPSTNLPVSTGYRAPAVDLATLEGDRAFRCQCGAIHGWSAKTAWVEDTRSLDQEIAAEMAHLGEFIVGPEIGSEAEAEPISAMAIQGRKAREARVYRESLHRPW